MVFSGVGSKMGVVFSEGVVKMGVIFSSDQFWSIEVVDVTLLIVRRDVPSMHRMRSR